jgi:hypothetical protein
MNTGLDKEDVLVHAAEFIKGKFSIVWLYS